MHINNPLFLPIIAHGATDVIDAPLQTLFLNAFSGIIFCNIKPLNRKLVLIISSIFHMGNDFIGKYKYIYSGLMHCVWLKIPTTSIAYLGLIHTPLHIKRQQIIKSNINLKYGTLFITGIIAYYTLNNNIDKYLDTLFGQYWWVSPVLTHIWLTEMIKNDYIFKYKINKIFNKLFYRIYNV